jgi:hypothetical protein
VLVAEGRDVRRVADRCHQFTQRDVQVAGDHRGGVKPEVVGTLQVPLGLVTQVGPVSAASPQSNEASAPRCVLRNLSITVVGGSAVSNQEAILLRFRNAGRTGYTLNGYPKVVALRPGASSTTRHRLNIYNGGWTRNQVPVVVLQPGQSASAVVGGASTTLEKVRAQRVITSGIGP